MEILTVLRIITARRHRCVNMTNCKSYDFVDKIHLIQPPFVFVYTGTSKALKNNLNVEWVQRLQYCAQNQEHPAHHLQTPLAESYNLR